jgi:hypothetical protein
MNTKQHFFQEFFGEQNIQNEQQIPEYIIHNEIVLEMINNWIYVQDLMSRFRAGELKEGDRLEQTWFNFIAQRNINITLYKNKEEFLNAFWKIPNN